MSSVTRVLRSLMAEPLVTKKQNDKARSLRREPRYNV
jgi:hypothetical protein